MNKNVERLYNGIIKENPTLRSDAWNVSYFGGLHHLLSTDLVWDFLQL